MNLHQDPDLLDRLAAEYAFGTLRGAPRRRLESLAKRDPAIQRALELWQRRAQSMGELVAPEPAPESVWRAIERRLGLNRAAETRPHAPGAVERGVRWFESLNFWRGWAIVSTAAAVLALGIALRGNAPAPGAAAPSEQRIAYMSVLNDKESRAALLATWDDAHGTLTLRRLASYPLRRDQALELWGLPSGTHPVSLGVLPAGAVVTLKMHARPQNYPVLAISLEPAGGSPDPNGPTGPVLWTGKLVPAT